jgi:hypothetical protein
MTTNRLSPNWRVHLLFGGGFLFVIAITMVVNLFSGETLLSATIDAFRQIRPFDCLMFVMFWYWFARGERTKDQPTLTSLNLGGSKF